MEGARGALVAGMALAAAIDRALRFISDTMERVAVERNVSYDEVIQHPVKAQHERKLLPQFIERVRRDFAPDWTPTYQPGMSLWEFMEANPPIGERTTLAAHLAEAAAAQLFLDETLRQKRERRREEA